MISLLMLKDKPVSPVSSDEKKMFIAGLGLGFFLACIVLILTLLWASSHFGGISIIPSR